MADEGSDLKDQGFDGTADVTQFITFIRRKALAVGRSRDKEWMADFAATQLNGEAFVWHLDLDPVIQADWDKLQRALVERYRSNTSVVVQANSSAGTVAEAPAAAPPPSVRGIPSSPSGGSGLLEGRIRVNTSGDTGYLSIHLDPEYNVFVFGTSGSDALRVKFRPSNFVHEITIPDFQSPFQCLGIVRSDKFKFGPGSHLHANLIPVTAHGVHPVKTMKTGLTGTASNLVWCYCPEDQQIRGIYTEGQCTYVMSVIMNKRNRRVLLVSDVEAVNRTSPQNHYREVTLHFETTAN